MVLPFYSPLKNRIKAAQYSMYYATVWIGLLLSLQLGTLGIVWGMHRGYQCPVSRKVPGVQGIVRVCVPGYYIYNDLGVDSVHDCLCNADCMHRRLEILDICTKSFTRWRSHHFFSSSSCLSLVSFCWFAAQRRRRSRWRWL